MVFTSVLFVTHSTCAMMTIELLGAQYGQEKPQEEEVEHWRNSA